MTFDAKLWEAAGYIEAGMLLIIIVATLICFAGLVIWGVYETWHHLYHRMYGECEECLKSRRKKEQILREHERECDAVIKAHDDRTWRSSYRS